MSEEIQTLEQPSATQLESAEAAAIDFTDYGYARFMALDAHPVSAQARSLVGDVALQIEVWERRSASRRNRRGIGRLVREDL